MAEEFRFKKRAAGPEFESSDELVLWAHDDGSLRTTDDDGQESTVGAGEQGEPGVGVPAGGTTAQVLAKATDADFDTEWVAASEGGSQPQSVVAWTGAVPCGDTPTGSAVGERFALVANNLDGTVTVIDIRTLAVLATVTVGSGPNWIGLTPDESLAIVTNYNDGTMSIIDLATFTVSDTVNDSGNSYTSYGAISPDGTTCFAPNGFDQLYFITLADGTFAKTAMTNGYWAAVSPDGATVAVGASPGTDVYIVDVATKAITHTVSVAMTGPVQQVVFTTDGTQIWVACGPEGTVVVLNASTGAIIDTLTFPGGFIYEVQPTPDGAYIVAVDCGGAQGGNNKTYVLDAATRATVATLDTTEPVFINFSPNSKTCFVTGAGIYVIDLETLTISQSVLPFIPDNQYGGAQGGLPTSDGTKLTLTDAETPQGNLLVAERLLSL